MLALAACSGTPSVAPAPGEIAEETFPDFPTFNGSPSDPAEAVPPDQTPAATQIQVGSIGCAINPGAISPGQTYQLFLTEIDSWYGKDRYYQVVGLPNEPYLEMQLADGGPDTRILFSRVAIANAGSTFQVNVFMRDWDIHGIRPGTVATTHRPEGTNHEASCSATFTIVPLI